jgi:hypothetical protein
MASDNFVERAFERADVEVAFEAHGGRDVVNDVARFKLIDEPQALLRKRERIPTRFRLRLPAQRLRKHGSLLFQRKLAPFV